MRDESVPNRSIFTIELLAHLAREIGIKIEMLLIYLNDRFRLARKNSRVPFS